MSQTAAVTRIENIQIYSDTIAIYEQNGQTKRIRGETLENNDFTNAKFLPLNNGKEYRQQSFLNCHICGADFSALSPDALDGATFSGNTRGLLTVKWNPEINLSKLHILYIPVMDYKAGPIQEVDAVLLQGDMHVDPETKWIACNVTERQVGEIANTLLRKVKTTSKTYPAHKALIILTASAIHKNEKGQERGIKLHDHSERMLLQRMPAQKLIELMGTASLENFPDLPDVVMTKPKPARDYIRECFYRALTHDPMKNQEEPSWDQQLHIARIAYDRRVTLDHPAFEAVVKEKTVVETPAPPSL